MRVGVPKEIKQGEGRVALTPAGARTLIEHGHEVAVERDAGAAAGFDDRDYRAAGAGLGTAEAAWRSDLVLKVKEPLEPEYGHLSGQILFTYLHLAGVDPLLTQTLLEQRTTSIAYEAITDADGGLPLLKPMSAVAGSMAPLVGSYYLAKTHGGAGTLVGEILGERHGKVLVIGDGIVGQHAAKVAGALGGHVVLLGLDPERRRSLEALAAGITFAVSTPERISAELPDTDLVIGAVLMHGARAPWVVSEEMVASMHSGSVIVDVSIDQGGCIATSRPTTHADPVYSHSGVIHYCVANMPGAFPRTSTLALTSATFPYVLALADDGLERWLTDDDGRAEGVQTYRGAITCEPVAEALDQMDRFRAVHELLAG